MIKLLYSYTIRKKRLGSSSFKLVPESDGPLPGEYY